MNVIEEARTAIRELGANHVAYFPRLYTDEATIPMALHAQRWVRDIKADRSNPIEDMVPSGKAKQPRQTPGTPALHSAAAGATPNQVSYAKSLIATKLPAADQPAWLADLGDTPSKLKASAVIDKLKDRDDLVVTDANAASQKQLDLIAKLEAERGLTPHVGELSKSAASKLIEALFSVPKPAKPVAAKVELPDGFYLKGETYIRVVHTRDGQRQYASVWDGQSWDYQGTRPLRNLTADDRCSLEQAQVFGKLTEECGVCGRHLTDPESVELGIGPVCAKKEYGA